MNYSSGLKAYERLWLEINRADTTQKAVAVKLRMTQPYLSEILNGRRNPTDTDKKSIQRAFPVVEVASWAK